MKCGSDEFFVGRAGYLYGALWLNRMMKKIVVPFDIMHEIARTIIVSGKTYMQVHNSPCPLMYAYYGTEYLGAAHGLCAILQILIQVFRKNHLYRFELIIEGGKYTIYNMQYAYIFYKKQLFFY